MSFGYIDALIRKSFVYQVTLIDDRSLRDVKFYLMKYICTIPAQPSLNSSNFDVRYKHKFMPFNAPSWCAGQPSAILVNPHRISYLQLLAKEYSESPIPSIVDMMVGPADNDFKSFNHLNSFLDAEFKSSVQQWIIPSPYFSELCCPQSTTSTQQSLLPIASVSLKQRSHIHFDEDDAVTTDPIEDMSFEVEQHSPLPACSSNLQGNNCDMHTKSLVSVPLDNAFCQPPLAHDFTPTNINPTTQIIAIAPGHNTSSDIIGSPIYSTINVNNDAAQSTINSTNNTLIDDNNDDDIFVSFKKD